MTHPFITADSLGTLICEALEVNPGLVNRVIIDCDIRDGGFGLPDIQWTNVLKGAEVITTKEEK